MNKKILLYLVVITIAGTSCKMLKKTSKEKETLPTQVLENTTTQTTPVVEVVKEVKPEIKEVRVTQESVKVVSGEDQKELENIFFVILGSFSVEENARNFKKQLLEEGFAPVILENTTGNFRVSVYGTSDETDARSKILNIRTNYDKYKDVWLLMKK